MRIQSSARGRTNGQALIENDALHIQRVRGKKKEIAKEGRETGSWQGHSASQIKIT